MMLRWEAGRAVGDRQMIAHLYEVSERTVRRRCTALRVEPSVGRPRGTGVAVYDVLDAGTQLAGVAGRRCIDLHHLPGSEPSR